VTIQMNTALVYKSLQCVRHASDLKGSVIVVQLETLI